MSRLPHEIVIMLIAMFRSLFSEEYRQQQWIADLADDDLEAASEAAAALGDAQSTAAVPVLLELLAMTETDITAAPDAHTLIALIDLRQDVVRALGKIGDERAVQPLIHVLRTDADRGIRYEAADALRRIGTPEAHRALDAKL